MSRIKIVAGPDSVIGWEPAAWPIVADASARSMKRDCLFKVSDYTRSRNGGITVALEKDQWTFRRRHTAFTKMLVGSDTAIGWAPEEFDPPTVAASPRPAPLSMLSD
jgi:hypothetical protein